jgi:hypothetical protein
VLTLTQPLPPQTRVLPEHQPVTITIPPAATATPGGDGTHPVAFTGDWLADGCTCHTYREGYAGILTRRWNGWAVFSVTRLVAEAIVRRHHADFTHLMRQHTTGGDPGDAWLATLRNMASVTWLADMIVVDSRVLHDDDTMAEIVAPSPDGRYTIGWGWTWDDVDAADIHTVHTGHTR